MFMNIEEWNNAWNKVNKKYVIYYFDKVRNEFIHTSLFGKIYIFDSTEDAIYHINHIPDFTKDWYGYEIREYSRNSEVSMAKYTGERYNELYSIRDDGKIYVNSGPTVGRVYNSLEEAITKFDYDKCYVQIEGNWCHRTWLKCIVNPILRFIQFWTDKPYVIASITEFKDGLPYFKHYSFERVKYSKKFIFLYKKDKI